MQQVQTFQTKSASTPDLDLSRRLVRESLDFNEIYSLADTDGELMASLDAAIKTADAKFIGDVFGALVKTYIEVVAHRRADVEYDGLSESEAVNEVFWSKQ